MPSKPRNRVTTAAVAAAIAAGAVGVPAAAAHAEGAPSHAAFRLAGQPLQTNHRPTYRVAPTVHLIRHGDTLSQLATRYHTSVGALVAANHLADTRIVAGEQLTIPPASGADTVGSPAVTPRAKPHSGTGGSVVVRPGDTLFGIAQAHGVTVKALERANPHLEGTRLHPGQRINLPGAERSTEHRKPRKQPTHQTPKRHQGHSKKKVGTTFAGRKYDKKVTKAAQANKDALAERAVPSRAAMQRMVATTAKAHGLDPKLAQAIAYQESGFNMRSVSPANAVGVMQLIPSSVQWSSQMAGRHLDALDPQDNVLAGVLLLKATLDAAGGDKAKTIAGYYQGLASVKEHGMYADTKAYVASVTALMGRF